MARLPPPERSTTSGKPLDTGLHWVVAGYLVRGEAVLLLRLERHHFWVPPGGHVEPRETFSQALVREVEEEIGIDVRVLSTAPVIHEPDDNARPEPVPFYVDIEKAGFEKSTLVQFYYIEQLEDDQPISLQTDEIAEASWFTVTDLPNLPTFAQVRSVAAYALRNHPARWSSGDGRTS